MLIQQKLASISDKPKTNKPIAVIIAILIMAISVLALTSCKKDPKTSDTTLEKSRGKFHLSNTSIEYFRFDPASDQVYAVGYSRSSELETGSPIETYNLYKADRDLYSKLVCKDVSRCEPSPTGEYLLVDDVEDGSPIFKVIEAGSKKEIKSTSWYRDIRSFRFEPLDKKRWLSDGCTFWYTNKDGLYVHNVKTNKSEKLLDGDILGLSFSKDTRYFLYGEYKGGLEINGGLNDPYSDRVSARIGFPTKLKIFDRETKKSKVLVEEPSAWIDEAIMDSGNKTIYYSLTTAKRDPKQKFLSKTQIKSIGIDGFNKQVLSEKTITVELDRIDYLYRVYRLMFTKQEKGLLYEIENIEPDKNAGNYYFDLSTRTEKRAPGGHLVDSWDYNPKTNEVGWIDVGKLILKKVD
jgi:hypothetical protein